MQAALHRMVAHDDNPIHISPEGAIAAGFPGPILHGLATFGIVGKIVTDACADGDGARLRSLNVRFTGPVIPGDELEVRIWDPLGAAGGAKGAGGVSSYKPGAKQFRRTIPKTGESVRIVVFEAAIVGKGKESVVVRDGQAEFWEKDAAGSKL
ncbi:MaoC like domain-containing protein [Hyaloraphidium curvatum]|nr:MaoC like domain-containing protein [Hyaloraphidium curvatum]